MEMLPAFISFKHWRETSFLAIILQQNASRERCQACCLSGRAHRPSTKSGSRTNHIPDSRGECCEGMYSSKHASLLQNFSYILDKSFMCRTVRPSTRCNMPGHAHLESSNLLAQRHLRYDLASEYLLIVQHVVFVTRK